MPHRLYTIQLKLTTSFKYPATLRNYSGEDALVPDDFTEAELRDGIWWRHLVSGGVAGMVSRTCTAPLDRTKVCHLFLNSSIALPT